MPLLASILAVQARVTLQKRSFCTGEGCDTEPGAAVCMTCVGTDIVTPAATRQTHTNRITVVQARSAEVIVQHINKLSVPRAQHECQSQPFHGAAGDRQLLDEVEQQKASECGRSESSCTSMD